MKGTCLPQAPFQESSHIEGQNDPRWRKDGLKTGAVFCCKDTEFWCTDEWLYSVYRHCNLVAQALNSGAQILYLVRLATTWMRFRHTFCNIGFQCGSRGTLVGGIYLFMIVWKNCTWFCLFSLLSASYLLLAISTFLSQFFSLCSLLAMSPSVSNFCNALKLMMIFLLLHRHCILLHRQSSLLRKHSILLYRHCILRQRHWILLRRFSNMLWSFWKLNALPVPMPRQVSVWPLLNPFK